MFKCELFCLPSARIPHSSCRTPWSILGDMSVMSPRINHGSFWAGCLFEENGGQSKCECNGWAVISSLRVSFVASLCRNLLKCTALLSSPLCQSMHFGSMWSFKPQAATCEFAECDDPAGTCVVPIDMLCLRHSRNESSDCCLKQPHPQSSCPLLLFQLYFLQQDTRMISKCVMLQASLNSLPPTS